MMNLAELRSFGHLQIFDLNRTLDVSRKLKY